MELRLIWSGSGARRRDRNFRVVTDVSCAEVGEAGTYSGRMSRPQELQTIDLLAAARS